jgi:hypothetical protein
VFFEVDTETRTLCRGKMSIRLGDMREGGFDRKDLTMGGSLR